MPLSDSITFSYGTGIDTYNFDPRSLFTVNKEIIKTPSNVGLATKYSLTLNGHILPTGVDITDGKAGLTKVLNGTNALRDAFGRDFKLLLLQCNSDTPLMSGYPKVVNIDINNASDNYLQRADYTINLELASLTGGRSEQVGENAGSRGGVSGDLSASGLISLTDDFTIEFLDERAGGDIGLAGFGTVPSVFSIQRTLSAQGDPLASTGLVYTEPWQRAKDYVTANLGLTPAMTGLAGLMCVSGMNIANNFRNISINKTDGSVAATETFIAYTGAHAAIEEMEVNVERSNDSPHVIVSVNGTIQGLSTIDYNQGGIYSNGCPPSTELKFTNALAAWNGGVSGSLYARANGSYKVSLETTEDNRPIGLVDSLNLIPLSESVGYNPIAGTVIYSTTYDDRPDNVNPYALTESINYTFNYANDIFASLTILGRTNGPLFQSIGTVGPTVMEISIDALMLPVNGTISGLTDDQWAPYNNLVTEYENSLLASENVDRIFTNSHNETWQPQVGQYSMNKSWTLSQC